MPSKKSSSQQKSGGGKKSEKSKKKGISRYESDITNTFMISNIPVNIHAGVPKEIASQIESGEIPLNTKGGDIRIDIVYEKKNKRIVARHRQLDPKEEECIRYARVPKINEKGERYIDIVYCIKEVNGKEKPVIQSFIKPIRSLDAERPLDAINRISIIDHIPTTALFLTSEHSNINFPQLIAEGKKKWIIKSVPFESHKDENLFLVDNKQVYGIIKIKNEVQQIKHGSDDWKDVRDYYYDNHLIPTELFDKWFKGKDIYIYQVEPIASYTSPFKYYYEKGVQTFDLNPKIRTIVEGVPELKQIDDYTCTEMATRMIHAFYGLHVPDIDYLSEKCDVLSDLAPCMYPHFHVKLYGVRKFSGEEEKQFTEEKATVDMLKNEIIMGRPVLIRFQFPEQDGGDGHTVVVIGYNKSGFFFNDPGRGVYPPRQFFSFEEFEKHWNKTNNMAMFLELKKK